MNTLDLILAVPILIGAYGGFKKGFIVGVISLLALILGVFGGFYFLNWGISILITEFGFTGKLIPIISFIIIFIGIIIIVNFIGTMLKKFVQMILLGGVDKLAGALMGALMWTFLVSSLIWVAAVFKLSFPSDWEQGSMLLGYVKPVAPFMASILDGIIPAVSDIFEGLSELIDSAT
ncbi:MAG: CvpA family protein [Cyclobacteriaceae bacterium]|nr:CvpA family protein [Cyclobacteriaceae bacterium]